MRMFAIEYGGEDAEGPYTDEDLMQRTLAIIRQIEPNADIIGRECNPWSEQILGGLKPWKIYVDIINGEPVLPAQVSLSWPPGQIEGIQKGTQDYREYFAWAENEKAALLKLARLNKATQQSSPKVAAVETV